MAPHTTPRALVQEVRARTDIVALVDAYVPLRVKGTRHVAACPFCQDTAQSFSVSADVGLYFCFKCRASGDAVRFYERLEGFSFGEAVRELAARAGVEVPAVHDLESLDQPRDGIGTDMLTASWFGDDHREDPTACRMPTRERWRFDCIGAGLYRRVTERGHYFGGVYDRSAAIAATASYLLHEGRFAKTSATEYARGFTRRGVRLAEWAINGADRRYANATHP